MKSITIMTDIEGVAGVTSFEQEAYPEGKYYDHAKRLLTAEVNAAVEGLVKAGVEDILVIDGHGPGGVWFEDLIAPAKLLHGRPLAPRERWIPIVDQYEAMMIIGQHAMAGVATSNMNHTQSSRAVDYYKLNGKPIGEIAQSALYAGAARRPFIYLSGEQDACAEAEALIPGIVTTAVKQGLGRGSAISLSAEESRRRIREDVQKAVEQHRKTPIAPLVWPGPYTLEKRYFHTDTADAVASQKGVVRIDSQTVQIQANDIRSVIYA